MAATLALKASSLTAKKRCLPSGVLELLGPKTETTRRWMSQSRLLTTKRSPSISALMTKSRTSMRKWPHGWTAVWTKPTSSIRARSYNVVMPKRLSLSNSVASPKGVMWCTRWIISEEVAADCLNLQSYKNTDSHTHILSYTDTHRCTHTLTHTHTHTMTHTHTKFWHTYIHPYTDTHTMHSHTDTHVHSHIDTRTLTHTYTHTLTHAHSHTDTHKILAHTYIHIIHKH